ncbi:MAG: DNA polymerase IV [Alphaproteobacteria bacterium]
MQGEHGFCQDCLGDLPEKFGGALCPQCRSPRLIRHEELASLSIAHIDCDAFYAAVEKRDNPALLTKPVIIGGGKRGVVSTCCYVARTFGVHSAQPMFEALKRCPDAIVIKPNGEKYSAVGKEVRAAMQNLTPLVQPLSIDEAFLDLTGTERLHGMVPAKALATLQRDIEQGIGISVSVGLSHNKFLAKMASDERKPRGFYIVGRAETLAYLAPKPVSAIFGIGKVSAGKFAKSGLTHIHQLQAMAEADLARLYGETGLRLSRLARGIDARPVNTSGPTKSISSETTFMEDHRDFDTLDPILWRQAERVSARAKSQGYAGLTVTLKLKTSRFKSRTRSHTLADPTQLADVIYRTARPMLEKEIDGTAFRLLGIGISNLRDAAAADPGDLIDIEGRTRAKAEAAMDKIREKFGRDLIQKGRAGRLKEPAKSEKK